MIKDKLHTISDEDAIEVGKILLKSSTSDIFDFSFEEIRRFNYEIQHGVDAEESVNVFFNGVVKNNNRKYGWKDKKVMIKLIEKDRYHNYPYFTSNKIEELDKKVWKSEFLSNQIEAIEFLQKKELI